MNILGSGLGTDCNGYMNILGSGLVPTVTAILLYCLSRRTVEGVEEEGRRTAEESVGTLQMILSGRNTGGIIHTNKSTIESLL